MKAALETWARGMAALGTGAAMLCACATTPPTAEVALAPAAPASAAAPQNVAPRKPDLSLPAAPQRSEAEVWREAYRRADALKPVVEKDLALLVPAPLPEVAKPAAPPAAPPAPARPEPVPARAAVAEPAPPASKPSAQPAAAPAPKPEEARREPPEPKPAPKTAAKPAPAKASGRAGAPSIRVTEKYTIENGLPSSRVTAIFVDEEDAWVGTADAGIARYNFQEGNWFVTKAEDGLASNRVSDVTKYKGRVFVATQDGISVWDGAAWTTMDSAVDGKVKLFNAVMRVQEGLLWVAARTMYGGLLSFDGDKWKDRSTIKAGTLLNNVTDFTFSGNTLWIGTTNRGLFRFDGKDWATFTVTEGLASNFVYTLGVRGDNCYVGGCCGLSALEDGSWKIYDIAEGMPHSTVNALAVDGDLVWLGSKKGLGVFDGYTFTNFYTENGLTDDRITAVFVKGEELWVGTANGLNRIEKN